MPTNRWNASALPGLLPRPRDRVLSIDGRILGDVICVGERSFCFDFRGTTTWLDIDAVFTRQADVVTLIYEEMGVVRHSQAAS